jgi:hypothetical protein
LNWPRPNVIVPPDRFPASTLPPQLIPTDPDTTCPGAASETAIRTSDFGVIRSGCVVTVMVGFALTTETDVAADSLGLVLASPTYFTVTLRVPTVANGPTSSTAEPSVRDFVAVRTPSM